MYEQIGAIIVTYNPDENLFQLTYNLLQNIKNIIIIDNNSLNKNILKKLEKDVKIIYLKKNIGIAGALQEGIKLLKDNIKFFFTFDQDSQINKSYIDEFIKTLNKNKNISILCPKIQDKNLNIEIKNLRNISSKIVVCIQSGMLFDKVKYTKTSGINKNLFMYYVDDDICIKMGKLGEIKSVKTAILYHQDGNLMEKFFFNKIIKYNSRSETAIYYRARNVIYMIKNYSVFYTKDLIYDLLINMLFHKCRKKFLLYFFSGLKDGVMLLIRKEF